MGPRFAFRLLFGLVVVAAIVGAGMYGYNLGIAHGIVERGAAAVAAPGGAVPVVIWPRPWGFGFGFFPFFPLLFILFWVFAARALFWRGAWRGAYRGRACGYGGVPPAFEEWHRQAHARSEAPKPGSEVSA
jgi:hypothetical protein